MNYCLIVAVLLLVTAVAPVQAQRPGAEPQKANPRAALPEPSPAGQPGQATSAVSAGPAAKPDPFDGASVETMAAQCVLLATEAGTISIELYPEAAPETVRNFLNLVALGAYDTSLFDRVVPEFVIQAGGPATNQQMTQVLYDRMRRRIADEPNYIKHERGVVSMARADVPNSASSSFFILAGVGDHLDGKFAAFGRVMRGLDVVDQINHAAVEGEKPVKPVRIAHATVSPCAQLRM